MKIATYRLNWPRGRFGKQNPAYRRHLLSRLVRIVALIPTWTEKASKGVGMGESIYFQKKNLFFFWNPWTFMIYQEAETFMRALDIYLKKKSF